MSVQRYVQEQVELSDRMQRTWEEAAGVSLEKVISVFLGFRHDRTFGASVGKKG